MRRRRRRKRNLTPVRHMPPGMDVGAYSAWILPNQLPSHGPASVQPEKRLLLAVLEEAVRSWQRLSLANDPGAGRRARELIDWFASDDMSWPCGFANICETLGIDRGWARGQLGVDRMLAALDDESEVVAMGPPAMAKAS